MKSNPMQIKSVRMVLALILLLTVVVGPFSTPGMSVVFSNLGLSWNWPGPGFLRVPIAYAADITVDTYVDELNSDGDCSLREAIQAANTNTSVDACTPGSPGLDTIHVPLIGLYPLTLTGADPGDGSDNTTGDLDITEAVHIIGDCSQSTTRIEGAPGFDDRILHIASASETTISCMEIYKGNTGGQGGGVKVENSIAHFNDATFYDNTSYSDGGAIFIDVDSQVTMTDVSISSNQCINPTTCNGGGIANLGHLHVLASRIGTNEAENYGGGVFSFNVSGTVFATVILENVRLFGNYAHVGGGVYSYEALQIDNSLIWDNGANMLPDSSGAGVYFAGGGHARLRNVTLSNNRANLSGGGIYQAGGTLTLNNVTVTENSANLAGRGGGIYSLSGSMFITNSIIARNSRGGIGTDYSDCYNDGSVLLTHEYNLQGVKSSGVYECNFNGIGEMQGLPGAPLDAMLDVLSDNGGPDETHALLPGSPALDAGSPLVPESETRACMSTDQRGYPRPVDGDLEGTATCDMGAYEFELFKNYLPLIVR